jgi:DNA end-binding protein Ku
MARPRGPRSIWTGSIVFGLVNVPVRVFSAVHEHKLSFHLVHATDDGPIGYEKVCKLEDKPVPSDEIVKAFEISKGEFVQMTDEDFAQVQVEGQHTIELEDFVPYDDIDPSFFAHSYLVAPDKGAERPYALLVRAMEDSGLVGVGKFVMRNRQYLGCLRVRDGVIVLEQMYFADEVDPPKGVVPDSLPKVQKRELDMALALVERFTGEWKPSKYKDTYHDELCKIIEAKQQGKEVHRRAEPEAEGPPDLLEALRLSLEGSRRTTSSRKRAPAKRAGAKRKPARTRSR